MPSDELLPRLLGGRYQLEAVLGRGGMGVVYRATDLVVKRPVAIKLISSVDGMEIDEEAAGRFVREAKNTARLLHDHIVEVFDVGRTESGDLYFAMELLEGEALSARMRRLGRISPESTVHIAVQICEGLEVAHRAGIIHRDLKPANIMLVPRPGNEDFVKVLDFGVAKSYAQDQETALTRTGMLVGTVEYMAPEQIAARPVDGRTDIYSLGVLLYKMLAGKAPFKEGVVPALIHQHLNVMPAPINETGVTIPGTLDRIVLRCLAKKPEQRFESMAELARALSTSLVSEEVMDRIELGGDDPYAGFDTTPVGHKRIEFDDATIKFDKEEGRRLKEAALATTRAGAGSKKIPKLHDDEDRHGATALLPVTPPRPKPAASTFDDVTAKRSAVLDDSFSASRGPKTCAMCQTQNPVHARACVACGISLASDDQAAVRARVEAQQSQPPSQPHARVQGHHGSPPMPMPVAVPMPAPGLPAAPGVPGMPPTPPSGSMSISSGGHPQGYAHPHPSFYPGGPQPTAHGVQGPPGAPPVHPGAFGQAPTQAPGSYGPHSWPGAAPTQPPSTWDRFLRWFGLR